MLAFIMDLDPLVDQDPGLDPDPDPPWIRIFKSPDLQKSGSSKVRIFKSPDLDLESESQKGQKSDSGAGSRAGIVTPAVFAYVNKSVITYKTHFFWN